MEKKIIVAPSILAADFTDIKSALTQIEMSGVQWAHLDVMDGNFVPNISFGPKFIEDMRKHSSLIFDTHLMIQNPENYIEQFAKAGSDYITIHAEATCHIDRTLNLIKSYGKKAGISIIPSTPISMIEPILDIVDLVLIMSVNPGFGGQKLIPYTLNKITELQNLKNGRNYLVSIDGGVNSKTIDSVKKSGADVVVAGSAFFKAEDKKHLVEVFTE